MAVLGSDNLTHSTTFKFNINSADRVIIDEFGRVLIGTTTPSENLRDLQTAFDRAPRQQIQGINGIGAGLSIISWHSANSGFYAPTLWFAKSNASDDTIGTNSIVSNATVLGGIAFAGNNGTVFLNAVQIEAQVDATPSSTSMPGRLVFKTTPIGATVTTERMRITNIGHILIGQNTTAVPGLGNTTVGASFESATNGRALFISRENNASLFLNSNANTQVARFLRSGSQVGSITVTTTNTAYNTSSDYRLKENVVDLDGAIDRLKQLPVHRFNFIVEPEITVDGFIAHEAQEIVPECATGTKDEMRTAKDVVLSSDGKILSENIKMEDWESGKIPNEDDESTYPVDSTWTEEYEVPVYQGIDQAKIVPLLTAALQEAIEKIETLEARVLELEAS